MPLFHRRRPSQRAAAASPGRLKNPVPHLAFWAVAVLLCGGAAAEENGSDGKGANGANVGVPSPSIAASLPPQLADPYGIREELAERGVTFKLDYTAEAVANVAGGLRRGALYYGQDYCS